MAYKLAIFDLDGTLLDTVADLAAATNFALAENGFPTHPTEKYKTFVGNGINKLFERALPPEADTQDNILKIRKFFLEYYTLHCTDLSKPYPGIEDMLGTLQERGVTLAVASNKIHPMTIKLIAHFFPTINFVAVFGQREAVPHKPDPQVVFDILEIANIAKEETIYIGDSGVDMETAAAGGVDAVGVTWGFRPRGELQRFLPEYIVNSADEIVEIIGQA